MIKNQEDFEKSKQRESIACICDYCGKEFLRLKHNIERSWKIKKSDSCNEINCVQKKRTESNLIIFGTKNAFQNDNIKNKIAEKNLQTHGCKNPMQNKIIKEKHKNSCEAKYGVENVFQNESVKQKIKEKNIEKYGFDNPAKNEQVQNRMRKTMQDKYNFKHALQNDDLRQKAMDTCIKNHGCFPVNHYGKTQKEIQDWLNSFGFKFSTNRSLIAGKEIDLYESEKKIAIEYCGLHWHHELSPEPRDKNYHVSKFEKCKEKGVQLLTIFSDEWEFRNNQCKGHIKSILGINDRRLFARKCKVKEIDKEVGRDFFEKYHIQGKNSLGFVFFGLFFQEELVGAISLGRHNRQFGDLVLDRLCFTDGVQVVGGASKLFKKCIEWAKNNKYKKIISFSDNRWSLGGVYKALKFDLDNAYDADYSYVDIKRPTRRISKQSQKKQAVNCPEELTEHTWAQMRGLSRIWDCGKIRWIYSVK